MNYYDYTIRAQITTKEFRPKFGYIIIDLNME